MAKDIVKINAKGRVMVTLTRAQAMLIKPIIERILREYQSNTDYLNLNNAQDRVYQDLLQDLYLKYYTELDMSKDKYKLTLTKAQAIAWWDLAQTYPTIVECHPVMSVITDSLHQKLAR